MRLSIQQLAMAVLKAMEDEVLPTLEVRSWPASRIRSSVQLLQRIIDGAEHEIALLRNTSDMMRSFLQEFAQGGFPKAAAGLDLAKLRAALNDVPDTSTLIDLPAIQKVNVAYRELFCSVIQQTHERRMASGEHDEEFRTELHRLLLEMMAQETRIFERAARCLPM